MGNCYKAQKHQSYIDPGDIKDSTSSSSVGVNEIEFEEEIESYKKLPIFTEKLSTQLNMGFVSLISSRDERHHLPCYFVTCFHALVYIPQYYFRQSTQFTFQTVYFYASIGSIINENPIKQMIILANILNDRVEILQPLQSKRVDKSSIIMIRFQNKVTINRDISIIQSQKISQAGQLCCLKNNSSSEGIMTEMASIQYRVITGYQYSSDIFAQQPNTYYSIEQLQNTPNSKYISLSPLAKANVLSAGPIFSYIRNKPCSFIGFYSGNSKQASQQKYFNIFCISTQLSSIIHTKSNPGFITELSFNNKPAIQTPIKNFLSVQSSNYSKFHPQFHDYQHYKVKDNRIECDKSDQSKDLQLHKCLISKNSLPYNKGGKYSLKIQFLQHCSDSNGLITISFKQQKQFVKYDDKSIFFQHRMFLRIIKRSNVLQAEIGVNNQSFPSEASKQCKFAIHQKDYLTFYLDLKQKKLTCIIKNYPEEIFKQSQQIQAFSFFFPQQLHCKNLQLYFQANKGGQGLLIL